MTTYRHQTPSRLPDSNPSSSTVRTNTLAQHPAENPTSKPQSLSSLGGFTYLQPIAAQKLPDARIRRLLLRTFERDELVEVFVHVGGFAFAAVGGVGWTVSTISRSAQQTIYPHDEYSSPIDIMLIPHIPEEPDLALRHKHSHTKRMYRRVSKPFVVEPAAAIQPLEVLFIRFTTEET